MNSDSLENLDLSGVSAGLILRIRRLRREKYTIRRIAQLIGWPEGKSRVVLRRIAGPMPKATVRSAAVCDEILRRHVGCLYGGRW